MATLNTSSAHCSLCLVELWNSNNWIYVTSNNLAFLSAACGVILRPQTNLCPEHNIERERNQLAFVLLLRMKIENQEAREGDNQA